MAETTVNYNLRDAGYQIFAGQTITFTLLNVGADVDAAGDPVIGRGSVSSVSDSNGDGSLTVFNTGNSDTSTSYDITLPGGEHVQVQIPASADGGSIELATLLKDNQVSSSPVAISVYDAARDRANHTGDLNLGSLPGGSVTGALPVANGGTAATDASTARSNLGLGTVATQSSSAISIGGGTIDNVTLGTFSPITQARIDNLSFNGNSITSTDSNGNIVITPNGTGEVDISKADIDSGSIDGTAIGASSPSTGSFTSLDLNGGDLADAGDVNCDIVSAASASIGLNVNFNGTDSGDNQVTLTDNLANALEFQHFGVSYLKFVTTNSAEEVVIGQNLNLSDKNVTNAGDVNCDEVSVDDATVGLNVNFNGNTGTNKISLVDNLDDALNITEGSNSYMKFVTSDSGSSVDLGVPLDLDGNILYLDGDRDTRLEASTDDTITVTIGSSSFLSIGVNSIVPLPGNTIDLGATTQQFRDLFLDGTANIDSLVADTADINGGTIDGATLGVSSAITDARIDNIRIDGSTISSTDTDGDINLTPDGAGEVNISKVDIDSGLISGTTVIASSDEQSADLTDFDVSGMNVLFINTNAADRTVNTLSGGVEGQVLRIVKPQSNNVMNIIDESTQAGQKIYTAVNTGNIALTAGNRGGIELVCSDIDGSGTLGWVEVDHK